MTSNLTGVTSASGPAFPCTPPQTEGSGFSSERIALRRAIVRAWHRRDHASTDAQYEDANSTIVRLSNRLADLAAAPVGRVPSQEA